MAARPRLTLRLTFQPYYVFAFAVLLVIALLLIRRATERPLPLRELFPHSELRVGVDPSSPPFAAIGEDGLFGLEIDLAHELGTRIGLPVRFVALGYDGLYDALKTDQVDALIAGLTIDNTRLRDVHYSQPYFNAGLVLVSDNEIAQMKDLPGNRLAYEFGSEGDSEARTWLRRIFSFETALTSARQMRSTLHGLGTPMPRWSMPSAHSSICATTLLGTRIPASSPTISMPSPPKAAAPKSASPSATRSKLSSTMARFKHSLSSGCKPENKRRKGV